MIRLLLLALPLALSSATGVWAQGPENPALNASKPTPAAAPFSSSSAPSANAPAPPSTPEAPQPDPLALQREAAQRQARSVGAHLIPWSSFDQPAPPAECDPLPDSEVTPLIDAASKREQVDSKLIRAVMEQESALRPCALSPKGAQGLMQLMPDTAAQLDVGNVYDPGQNIDAGARYLKQLLDRYKGNLKQALAAYNAGPGEVDKVGGVPNISETQTYVDNILKKVSPGVAPSATPPAKPPGNY